MLGNQSQPCTIEGNFTFHEWNTEFLYFKNSRSTHEVVAIDECVYALGGNDGSSSLNSVEMFDPKSNKWTLLSSMVTRRSSVGAAVLDCINIEHVLRATKSWQDYWIILFYIILNILEICVFGGILYAACFVICWLKWFTK